MRISILVPVYGVEKYIERCAVSLFEQTYEDIEYIFVDDCSPDGSIDVLRNVMSRYPAREKQVRIIRHEGNMGLGAARATAMEAAQGEYVMFVDSDDFISRDAAEVLMSAIESSGADIADGGFVYYTGTENDAVYHPSHDTAEVFLRKVLIQNIVAHAMWARLIRRKLFTDNDIKFQKGINHAEDYSVLPRVLFGARRIVTDSIVYYYRIDRASMFSNGMSMKNLISYLKANGMVYRFFASHDITRKYSFALQTGLLNAYRSGIAGGLSYGEIEDICGYRPDDILFRLCHIPMRFFRSSLPSRLFYLIIKRLYRILVFHDLRATDGISDSKL